MQNFTRQAASPCANAHRQARVRLQHHVDRLGSHRRRELEAISMKSRREDELRLHEGKAISDALVRSRSKREKRELRSRGRLLGGKALWIEAVGIVPEFRMPVGQEVANEHEGLGADGIAADLVVTLGLSWQDPSRWVPPHRFLEHHAGIPEIAE